MQYIYLQFFLGPDIPQKCIEWVKIPRLFLDYKMDTNLFVFQMFHQFLLLEIIVYILPITIYFHIALEIAPSVSSKKRPWHFTGQKFDLWWAAELSFFNSFLNTEKIERSILKFKKT